MSYTDTNAVCHELRKIATAIRELADTQRTINENLIAFHQEDHPRDGFPLKYESHL